MSKFIIRLLRDDESVHREEDGAVRFDHLAELFKSRFAANSHWSIQAWISFLAEGGGQKKRFQYCLNPHSSENPRTFRVSLILHCKTMYCYRMTEQNTSTTSGTLTTIDSAVCVLHSCESDEHPSESRRSSIRPELQRPRRWGPQVMPQTGGGGTARVPNLRVYKHLIWEVAHAGEKGKSTSCRGTV